MKRNFSDASKVVYVGEEYDDILIVGKKYSVKRIHKSSNQTEVVLNEHPNHRFNMDEFEELG